MNESARIVRRSLHAELVGEIRAMIVEGTLAPGDKIAEQALSDRFGVSRTPLREALKFLAAEGLVQLLPNRGAIVARITAKEIDELFPILGTLEALAGELALANATDADIAGLRRLHEAMIARYRAGKQIPYLKLNRQFHEALFRLARNDALMDMYRQLLVRTHSVRFIVKKNASEWHAAVDDHEEIIAAIAACDATRLAAILKTHMTETAASIARRALSGTTAASDSTPARRKRRPVEGGGGARATRNSRELS
jgi:DNA-binding GntR family transcriptional regulator